MNKQKGTSKSRYYVLDGHTPMPATLQQWARFMDEEPTPKASRQVAATTLPSGVYVSTVFLGLDHGYGKGPPILFETMVFHGALDQEQERYATWDEAVTGHERMVERAKGAESDDHPAADL